MKLKIHRSISNIILFNKCKPQPEQNIQKQWTRKKLDNQALRLQSAWSWLIQNYIVVQNQKILTADISQQQLQNPTILLQDIREYSCSEVSSVVRSISMSRLSHPVFYVMKIFIEIFMICNGRCTSLKTPHAFGLITFIAEYQVYLD
jgi:hypothetical protein